MPDDVKRVTVPAMAHRIILRAESRLKGVTGEQVMEEILGKVAVPKETPEVSRTLRRPPPPPSQLAACPPSA